MAVAATTDMKGRIGDAYDFDIAEVMAHITDRAMAHVPLDTIIVREGFNPRRYFSPGKMTELTESIKNQGVIQPIVVKPNDDNTGFYLIAGERRLRAANTAKVLFIPVIVRLVSDEEALAMAISENLDRDDMSASEEAKACHRMMAFCDGDREETARALGWSRHKLDSRLLLLHCSDAVLESLEQRTIQIGHAELLAGLSKELQDQSLPGIVGNQVSVADLRESIGRYAYKLADAVFNTSDCTNCPHNSNRTSDLFDTNLGDGRCMNRECYDDKTKNHLNQKKRELAEQYPVIWLDVEKPEESRCYLVREGEQGVGKEQYRACQGCANYGALMLTGKGNEGSIEEAICFDRACNGIKVAEYKKELSDEAKNMAKQQHATSSKASTSKTKSTAKKPVSGKKKNVAEVPKRVKEFVNKIHYAAAGKEVAANNKLIKVFSLVALSDALKGSSAKTSMTDPVLKQHGVTKLKAHGKRSDKIKELATLEDAALSDLIRVYAGAVAGENQAVFAHSYDDNLVTAQTALVIAEADLSNHFIVDKTFLESFTISGLQALIEEAGFDKWYDEKHGDGAYKKSVLKGKRDEQISAIIKAGFDWNGFIPKVAAIPGAKEKQK